MAVIYGATHLVAALQNTQLDSCTSYFIFANVIVHFGLGEKPLLRPCNMQRAALHGVLPFEIRTTIKKLLLKKKKTYLVFLLWGAK